VQAPVVSNDASPDGKGAVLANAVGFMGEAGTLGKKRHLGGALASVHDRFRRVLARPCERPLFGVESEASDDGYWSAAAAVERRRGVGMQRKADTRRGVTVCDASSSLSGVVVSLLSATTRRSRPSAMGYVYRPTTLAEGGSVTIGFHCQPTEALSARSGRSQLAGFWHAVATTRSVGMCVH
jgi:hypothetical protein